MQTFARNLGVKVVHVDASEQFLDAARAASPIPSRSARSSAASSSRCSSAKPARSGMRSWLAQGTIYPDVIESAGAKTKKAHDHQVAPQRRRAARDAASEAARAVAGAVQGRSARAGSRAGPAARDGVSPSLPGAGTGRAHPRRGQSRVRRPAAPCRRDLHRRAARRGLVRQDQPGVRGVPAGELGGRDGRRAHLRARGRAARRADRGLHDRALGRAAARPARPRCPTASSTRCAASTAWCTTSPGKPPATIEWE